MGEGRGVGVGGGGTLSYASRPVRLINLYFVQVFGCLIGVREL